MADRRRIGQVLNNLLSNAARHSSERSSIRVSAVWQKYHVAISVTDEGKGIQVDRLRYLFRKFSRIDAGDQRGDLAGSGLGLSICRGIVEGHGGRIWAESDGPGLGARFTFTVPVVEQEGVGGAVDPSPLASHQDVETEGRKRILAVDDDPQTLRYVRDALSKAGYAPIVTGDPEDVDRLLEEKKPHLVLLDLMLPGAYGIDLMKQIMETAEVPVIFLSAYGQENIIARAFEMGAADYVVKPFAPTELAARIKSALLRRTVVGRLTLPDAYVRGELTIDFGENQAIVAGYPVELTATEYALLYELSVNAGLVVTHDQLLRRVWGEGNSGDSGLVRTIVKRLRNKLGDDARNPAYIYTQSGVGYRMKKNERSE